MYRISDFIGWTLRKVLRYRFSIVSENIQRVYPKINENEKDKLTKEIYRNLSDITLEGIKGLSMSEKQIKKRHFTKNPEILDLTYEKNKSVILVTGHYNNWEWGAFSPNYFLKHQIVAFYKPLTNPLINKFVVKKRANAGSTLADINQTSQFYKEYVNEKSVFLVAADQSPTKPELAIWIEFLGIETPCLHGLEKYLDKYDLPVVYCYIDRVSRGHYELTLEWIKDPSASFLGEGEVTKRYMKTLEKVIYKTPQNWLWTHRRWKHIDYRSKPTKI